jgi:hypothetical protein
MRHSLSKPKNLSSSKIWMQGPVYCWSDWVSNAITSNKLTDRTNNYVVLELLMLQKRGKTYTPIIPILFWKLFRDLFVI